jgi:superfamily II DNA or RNA helicase
MQVKPRPPRCTTSGAGGQNRSLLSSAAWKEPAPAPIALHHGRQAGDLLGLARREFCQLVVELHPQASSDRGSYLVIVDEAHRMSAADESHKSLRYRLGELLRDSSDHILLLTATPHKGDPVNFSLFLQLLDADAYADVKSIREAMDRRRAPFYLRRTKEAMVYFPERRVDGSWAAEPIFTKRIPVWSKN